MADLIGQVTLLASAHGGRKSEAYSGFGPLVKLADGPCAFELRFMCDDFLRPGESDAATIDIATPEKCRGIAVGQVFELLENQRVIGHVKILENLWVERQKKN